MNETCLPNLDANAVTCIGLEKRFDDDAVAIRVLDNITAAIKQGDEIAIIGASGSGKTTLLQLLGGLDTPTAGKIYWQRDDLSQLSLNQIAQRRNRMMGFIYQFHHLLSEFTAQENVSMPLRIRRIPPKEAMEKAASALEEVGLAHRLTHLPSQLSGGERQRVAIARAIVHDPKVILADEPTGNLDRKTALQVFELLRTLNQKRNTALIVVTHDVEIANTMKTIWHLEDGRLTNVNDQAEQVLLTTSMQE